MASTATDKATAAPRRKRRWFQFGLRTLLALVTVACLVLGIWVQRAERQRRAVALVQSVGGKVFYQDGQQPAAPVWLRELVGDDYFRTVDGVGLGKSRISDAGLVRLKGLTGLKWLDLSDTQVTDAGLVHLKGLTGLLVLDPSGTQASDAGIAELRAALPTCQIVGP